MGRSPTILSFFSWAYARIAPHCRLKRYWANLWRPILSLADVANSARAPVSRRLSASGHLSQDAKPWASFIAEKSA